MNSTPDATVRVEARFKNARLYNCIADSMGEETDPRGCVAAFCRRNNFDAARVRDLLNLRLFPWRVPVGQRFDRGSEATEWRDICLRLADVFFVEPSWLFPRDLYRRQLGPVAIDVEMSRFVQLRSIHVATLALPPTQEEDVEHTELAEMLTALLETLTPRQKMVMQLRFGLGGHDAKSLAEVGGIMGVGSERIRQIEAAALRKLRHPRRSRQLRSFIDLHPDLPELPQSDES